MQRRLRLAELGGGHREGRAGAELADDLLDEAPGLALGRRVFHRDEDFRNLVLRLAGARAGGAHRLLHLGLRGLRRGAELLAQQPAPADLGADLVVEHAGLDAELVELGAQPAGLEVVAPLQLIDRLRHLGIRHGQAAALHLLGAQPLVHQQPGDLGREAFEHLGGDGDAGAEREEPGAADDVGAAHHVAVHHRDDAVALRRDLARGGQLRRGRCGQRCEHG